MTRYTVWAVFGVDADSPEQAKSIVNRILEVQSIGEMNMYSLHRVNVVVLISPGLDKMLDEIEEE